MIYLRCECGNGIGVPGSFLGEAVACDDCGRRLRLVAGEELANGATIRWRLEIKAGPAGAATPGEQVLLGGNAAINAGTAETCPLHLPGELVSRSHCVFEPIADDDAGGWSVRDAGSRNGVFVNGGRIADAPQALQPGDVVRVGEFELQYAPAGRPFVAHVASRPVEEQVAAPAVVEAVPDEVPEMAPVPERAGPRCPSCRRTLAFDSRICIDCGIDIFTGKPLLTAQGLDEDTLHTRAHRTIWVLSWIVPFGLYPIASEARGLSKPYATYAIAIVTIFVSFSYSVVKLATPPERWPIGSSLMLWSGDAKARAARTAEDVRKLHELQTTEELSPGDEALVQEQLAAAQRPVLPYEPHQLFTHALLHDGFLHIAGNLLF
jgi:hypothetical protein